MGRAVDALLDEPPTHLIVAIDGLTDETDSRYRIGAKLEPLLAGVRRLVELKRARRQDLSILHMRWIAMRQNEAQVPDAEDWARAQGFDFLSIRGLLTSAGLASAHRAPMPERENLRAFQYSDGRRIPGSGLICQQPSWFPALLADGTLVACEQDHNAEVPLGVTDAEQSFADVWTSPLAARVRSTIRNPAHRPGFCRECRYAEVPTSSWSLIRMHLNPGFRRPFLAAGEDCQSI